LKKKDKRESHEKKKHWLGEGGVNSGRQWHEISCPDKIKKRTPREKKNNSPLKKVAFENGTEKGLLREGKQTPWKERGGTSAEPTKLTGARNKKGTVDEEKEKMCGECLLGAAVM